jgi:hypothetical protein
MEETVGQVSTCGRELIREWWWPICRMVSFMIFTASVQNILGTHSYILCRNKQMLSWLRSIMLLIVKH